MTVFGLSAQTKMLTMEEAVLGYHLRPQNQSIQWQGDLSIVAYISENKLISEDVSHKKKRILMTPEELSGILKQNLMGWPQYTWKDPQTMTFIRAGKYYEIDIPSKSLKRSFTFPKEAQNIIFNGKDGFAFTKENNLYYMNEGGEVVAITRDQDRNIINGQIVSRNEFGIDGGIFWSPDGKQLAFYRKDESEVGVFPLLDITTRTGSLKEIKYPMAGMKSEQISLGVYNIASQQAVFLDVTDFDKERYLTNITWSPASDYIYVQVLNRAQKHLKLNQYNAKTGAFVKTLLEERNEKFVEPVTPIVFLKNDASRFIYRTNNRDGYFNLYLCNLKGQVLKRITNVNADVDFVGEDGKYVYYTSAEVSPVDKHLFKVDIKSGKKTRLTKAEGWHDVVMSADMKYFIDNYSSLRVPRVIELTRTDGKIMRELLCADDPMKDYELGEVALGTVKGTDGVTDHYYRLIKPIRFDASKKYPVIIYVYGGPHSQMVKNTWMAEIRMWEMYMAQHGYIVYVMDNRGTSNRGKAYEDAIYGQCGQKEMEDQMQGVRFLTSQPWVDAGRIGVHGWSYGGFMTISLITNYPDIFKVAVAGGPVIDWKWYEIMYGERYMGSPDTNPEGYNKTSLINKAKNLKGKLLICQGAVDPVVVWEHSLSFIQECIKNNVQVDYFPYPRAEHNVMGRDRIHLMQKVTDYFEDYLK